MLVPEVVVEYSPSGTTKSVVQDGGTPVAYATNDVGLMEAESCLILSTVQEMQEPVAPVLSENSPVQWRCALAFENPLCLLIYQKICRRRTELRQ